MRETQGILFKTHGNELVPPHSGSATSRQAAEAIEPDALASHSAKGKKKT